MGDSPFGHGSSEVMLYRVVHEEAQLRGVPDALAPLVRACLAKDPEERPSTLQLSMRLKEIAAREAQGGLHGQVAEARPPAQRERVELDRPTGRLDDRTQRYTEAGRGTGAPAARPAPRTGGSAPRTGARVPAGRAATPPPVPEGVRALGPGPAPPAGCGPPTPGCCGSGSPCSCW